METHLLEAADTRLADRLTSLVNTVYEASEEGLWRDGATRTAPCDMLVYERPLRSTRPG